MTPTPAVEELTQAAKEHKASCARYKALLNQYTQAKDGMASAEEDMSVTYNAFKKILDAFVENA